VGISQIKTREVGIKRAIIIPSILILLSIYAILHDFGIHFLNISIWTFGILLVFFLNKIIKSQKEVQYNKETKSFTVKGSMFPLCMMMMLFFTKYSVGLFTALESDVLHTSLFIGIISLLYGVFCGAYIIRFFTFYNKI